MSQPHEVQSPLPGTFYRKPSPDAPPYKEAGDAVSPGQVIGLIEVMKQFTEVTAEVGGRIREFLIADGEPIEPGQVIARIDEA